MSRVKIVSDGTSQGTRVHVGDEFMSGITKIEVNPIKPDGLVTANITVDFAQLQLGISEAEIECYDVEAREIIKQVIKKPIEESND